MVSVLQSRNSLFFALSLTLWVQLSWMFTQSAVRLLKQDWRGEQMNRKSKLVHNWTTPHFLLVVATVKQAEQD